MNKFTSCNFELTSLLKQTAKTNNDIFDAYLNTAKDISSDSESARFLISVIDTQSMDEESKAVLFGAADSLGSDFEQNRVLRRIRG